MKIKAYYNEIDSFCCGWLSNLMDAGVITPGVIDNRSIEDVSPDDVAGFTRVGFFAGIGVWDYALRLARWPDDRPVWHGSCPCQPFSSAGKGAGFADERHLWPAFFHLIEQCRPAIVFGEQVACKAVEPWIDLVQTDLEAVGYAFGCVPFPSASVGAPHIRDRAYWVANSSCRGWREEQPHSGWGGARTNASQNETGRSLSSVDTSWMADSNKHRCCQGGDGISKDRNDGPVGDCTVSRMANPSCAGLEGSNQREMGRQYQTIERSGGVVGLADSTGKRRQHEPQIIREYGEMAIEAGSRIGTGCDSDACLPRPTNGFWRDVDWLFCRDGKWRPVELGTFPLATGATQRVGRLRGYGNAINAEAAKAFITAFMEAA